MSPQEIHLLYSTAFRPEPTVASPDFWVRDEMLSNQERANAFKDRPDFGWEMAKLLARSGTPRVLRAPSYRWIRKAVAVIATPRRITSDPALLAVADARQLHQDPDSRAILQAALLTPDANAPSIADALGLDPTAVEAFASLFFNVVGRSALYLRKVAHAPQPRSLQLVADPTALDHGALLRTGLKGTLEDVLELAGCGRHEDGDDLSPSDSLLHSVLRAGKVWLASRPNSTTPLSPEAVQAIQIAKQKTVAKGADEFESDDNSTGTFYDIVSAQLARDGESMRAAFVPKANDETLGSQPTADWVIPRRNMERPVFSNSSPVLTLELPIPPTFAPS